MVLLTRLQASAGVFQLQRSPEIRRKAILLQLLCASCHAFTSAHSQGVLCVCVSVHLFPQERHPE
jgi:hypothetical protein